MRLLTGLATRLILAALAVALVTAFVALNAAMVYVERRIDGLPPEVAEAVNRQIVRNAAPDFDGLAEFAVVVSVSALLGSLVGVVLAHFIARPVVAVAAAARRIAAGDLDARVHRRRAGRDEVGRLVEDFNALADGLARLERERRVTAAALAHELRTPVAILQGRLEAARDDVLPLGADGLSALVDQTRLLGRLIDDLKTLSLADAGQLALHRRAVDVGALASSVVRGFEAAAAARQVALQVDVVAATVDGDPARLVQVVVILLDNALRHTPAGGEIRVGVTAAAAAAAPTVRVTVADTGPGVPAGGADLIFERFVSRSSAGDGGTPDVQGGSGQGLAIARAIARAHGGEVTVRDRPGGGAAFTLSLPAAPARE